MTAPLRSDARRNRDRIVRAAREAFATEGLEVGVDEIARRAGVGTGTLYRRFATKDALIGAIIEERLDELAPAMDAALAGDDAWAGFREVVQAAVALQAADQGFVQLLVQRLAPDELPGAVDERFFAPLGELLARAQAAGQARADIAPGDLQALLRMAGAAALLPETPAARRRHVGFLLDGLSAGASPRSRRRGPTTAR